VSATARITAPRPGAPYSAGTLAATLIVDAEFSQDDLLGLVRPDEQHLTPRYRYVIYAYQDECTVTAAASRRTALRLHLEDPTHEQATRADLALLGPALDRTRTLGLRQIAGRMGQTDAQGDLCGACVTGQITETYRRAHDPGAHWTTGHGPYDTQGSGLPGAVWREYGLSSATLNVDLRRLDACVQEELSAALGETTVSGPVVNITSLNDVGVGIPLLLDVIRGGVISL